MCVVSLEFGRSLKTREQATLITPIPGLLIGHVIGFGLNHEYATRTHHIQVFLNLSLEEVLLLW